MSPRKNPTVPRDPTHSRSLATAVPTLPNPGVALPASEVHVAAEGGAEKPAPARVVSSAPAVLPPPPQAPVVSVERFEPLPVPPVAAVDAQKPRPTRDAAPGPPTAFTAQPKTPPPAEPVAVLRAPTLSGLLPAEASPRVSVRTVEAPGVGRLEVRGMAEPNSRLRLYLNGSPIADASAGADQRWSLTIEHGMSPGLYIFRADEIDGANGAVSARAEVPFSYPQRPVETGASLFDPPSKPLPVPTSSPAFRIVTEPDAKSSAVAPHALSPATSVLTRVGSAPTHAANPPPPKLPSAVMQLALSPAQAVIRAPRTTPPTNVVIADVQTTTVAHGDNLWNLARRFYGDGMRFRQLYAANAWRIHEPRLIYIGQKFVVPKQIRP